MPRSPPELGGGVCSFRGDIVKRLVVCCDGTWNTPDQASGGEASPTNVTKIALQVAEKDTDEVEQRVYYDRGVGTGRLNHLAGGIFGLGLTKNVKQAYAYLVECYEPGDEIYFFGFSRGAYTARSVAGLIRNSGLLRPECRHKIDQAYTLYRDRRDDTHPNAVAAELFRRTWSHEVPIHFIGVFDTVGALGIPGVGLHVLTRRWQFHDTALSSRVCHAAQALALHERRRPFRPALWSEAAGRTDPLRQVWFTGVHSDVGGGYAEPELAEIPLRWMAERATAAGLRFREGAFGSPVDGAAVEVRSRGDWTAPSAAGRRHESFGFPYTLLGPVVRTFRDDRGGMQQVASTAHDRDAAHLAGDRPPTDRTFAAAGTWVVGPYDDPPGLRVGETVTATVRAGRRWRSTGIVLESGAGYAISVFGSRWSGSVPDAADGSEHPDRRDFTLVGSVGTGRYCVVDCRWQGKDQDRWELVCRARPIGSDHDDVPGSVQIRVSRPR